jgi:pyruvate carboxylase subunit B
MKYLVDVEGERVVVALVPGGVEVDGEFWPAGLDRVGDGGRAVLRVGDAVHAVVVRQGEAPSRWSIEVDGRRVSTEALDERAHAVRALAAAAAAARPTGPTPLLAPMPGLIVRVGVAVGDAVAAGQGLVVMEAMKMENELRATAAGTVTAIHVTPGQAVEKGAQLVSIGA